MNFSALGRATLALACLACPGARAGGVFCNSARSAEYLGCLDRNSALDGADIAYYNMAGTVRLPPGLSLNLSNQAIFQRATVDTLGNPALGDRRYASDNPVWFVPNAYLVYRRGNWAGFMGLETLGATAVRRWPDGLPSMDLAAKQAAGYGGAASALIGADAAVGAAPARSQAAAAAAALDAGPFTARSWLRGSSCFLAWRHGAARRCGRRFALALAGRLVAASQQVTGGALGACTYDQRGHDLRGTAELLLDVRQRALGYSAEACVDFFPAGGVVLSLTCELATRLEFRTQVRDGRGGGGRFADGSRARLDLPQVWRFGVGWPATSALRLSGGVNLYREGSARMDLLDEPAAGIDARRDYRDTWEGSAALAWRLDDRRLLRAGVLYTRIGQRRAAILDTSPPGAHADYLSLAAGGRWRISEGLLANAGAAWTAFVRPVVRADGAGDRSLREACGAAGLDIDPRKRYDKRYLTLALGIEWRLPV